MGNTLIPKHYDNVFFGSKSKPLTYKKRKGTYSIHAQLFIDARGRVWDNIRVLYIHVDPYGATVGVVRKWAKPGDPPLDADTRVKRDPRSGAWYQVPGIWLE